MEVKKFSLLLMTGILGLSFIACGEEPDTLTSETCEYKLEYNLDKATSTADYEAIITLVDGKCKPPLISSDNAHLYKGAAYMGVAGLSITGLMADMDKLSEDPMGYLGSQFSDAATMVILDRALIEYDAVTGGKDCKTTTEAIVKSACAIEGFVKPIKAISTMSVLAGEPLTYNGKEVSALSAMMDPSSVGVTTGTNTEFDVDGDGSLDSSQSTGMAMGYAVKSSNDTGITTVSASVDFTKDGTAFGTYQSISTTITGGGGFDDSVAYHLITPAGVEDNRQSLTTSGACKNDFTTPTTCDTSSEINGTDCFPCPVVGADGSATSSAESVAGLLNSSDDPQMAEASSMLDCDKNGTVSDNEVSYYMSNGSCDNYQE